MELTFRAPDREAVMDVFGPWDMEHDRNALPGCLVVELCEVNYGGQDDLVRLAERGVTFLGRHGPGDEYGPAAFAACDGQLAMVDADRLGRPVVRVDPDSGEPDPQDRTAAAAYAKRRRRAIAILGRGAASLPPAP